MCKLEWLLDGPLRATIVHVIAQILHVCKCSNIDMFYSYISVEKRSIRLQKSSTLE